MAKMSTLSKQLIVGVCCTLLLCGAVTALSLSATAQNTNSNQAQPPKKKKLPAGSKGFEQ